MLTQLKTLMQQGDLPTIAYHFADYVYSKSNNMETALAAALLSQQHAQGHVCIDLRDYTAKTLFINKHDEQAAQGIQTPLLSAWLTALAQHPWVSQQFPSPLILEKTRLYLGKYWQFETQLAAAITARIQKNHRITVQQEVLISGLQRLFPHYQTKLDWQAVAAVIAVLNRFVIISGGPGTGKTSTVIRILALLLAQNPAIKIELVAPTGKAAARLAESIRIGKTSTRLYTLNDTEQQLIPTSAKTIHRLLGYSPRGFKYHKHNLLAVDTLVVDEASMIDLSLMTRLIEAVPAQTQIILLGDKDQLASVEAGSVLSDLTGHQTDIRYSADFIQELEKIGVVPKEVLTASNTTVDMSRSIALLHKSYRFDQHSGIGTVAKLINQQQGEQALYDVLCAEKYADVQWISQQDSIHPQCLHWAVQHYRTYLCSETVADALNEFEKVRILSALRQGEFGVENINTQVISHLQQAKLIPVEEDFHGKPIMINQNDYELDLFNGDIGLLWQESENAPLYAYFPAATGEVRRLLPRQLPQHSTAFAMTIHKSQGSEFEQLLLILPVEMNPVLSKELMYTGITRAKQTLSIAGEENTFINACRTTLKRQSGLAEKLGW